MVGLTQQCSHRVAAPATDYQREGVELCLPADLDGLSDFQMEGQIVDCV